MMQLLNGIGKTFKWRCYVTNLFFFHIPDVGDRIEAYQLVASLPIKVKIKIAALAKRTDISNVDILKASVPKELHKKCLVVYAESGILAVRHWVKEQFERAKKSYKANKEISWRNDTIIAALVKANVFKLKEKFNFKEVLKWAQDVV